MTQADIPAVVECIMTAFADDPWFQWIYDDPAKYSKERNITSLTSRVLWGLNNAMFYVAKETPPSLEQTPPLPGQSEQQASRLVGVSMWLHPEPPSEPESWYSYFQHWLLFVRQVVNNVRYLGYGGLNVKRYWIWKSRQAEAKRQILTDPRGYYWCGILAVNQEMRRKGLGRKLVEIMTNQADREGMKCYLESSKLVPNVDIYRGMGFETAFEISCEDEGDICKVYSMIRDPKQTKPQQDLNERESEASK